MSCAEGLLHGAASMNVGMLVKRAHSESQVAQDDTPLLPVLPLPGDLAGPYAGLVWIWLRVRLQGCVQLAQGTLMQLSHSCSCGLDLHESQSLVLLMAAR